MFIYHCKMLKLFLWNFRDFVGFIKILFYWISDLTGRPDVYRQSTVSVSGWSGRPDQSTGVLAECTYPCACLSVDRRSTGSRPRDISCSLYLSSRPAQSTGIFFIVSVKDQSTGSVDRQFITVRFLNYRSTGPVDRSVR